MKKIILVFLLSLNCFVCFGQHKLSSYDSLKTMPPFKYYTLQGDTFTQNSLNEKWKTVVVYFNPGCEFCQKEAKIISDSISYFPNTQFIFLSRADSASIQKFSFDYNLVNNPQIIMLCDKNQLYYTFTIARYTPSIHVYNENKKLIYFGQKVLSKNDLVWLLK